MIEMAKGHIEFSLGILSICHRDVKQTAKHATSLSNYLEFDELHTIEVPHFVKRSFFHSRNVELRTCIVTKHFSKVSKPVVVKGMCQRQILGLHTAVAAEGMNAVSNLLLNCSLHTGQKQHRSA